MKQKKQQEGSGVSRPVLRAEGHIPVLLHEVIRFLDPAPGAFLVDGTLGDGGHARGLLRHMRLSGSFLGIDLDPVTLEDTAAEMRREFVRETKLKLEFLSGNYADIADVLRRLKLGKADALLLDLGFSSRQLKAGRGFSFLADEPLDMRYGASSPSSAHKSGTRTAAEVVNMFREEELAQIFRDYGEERFAPRFARAICAARKKQRILRTSELAEIVRNAAPGHYERGRIHPATRVFQALRIFVNDELGSVKRVLEELPCVIETRGRVAIMSFHSLEDRLVKNAFRDLHHSGAWRLLTKKPVTASPEEVGENPRSRSAKLRAIERIA